MKVLRSFFLFLFFLCCIRVSIAYSQQVSVRALIDQPAVTMQEPLQFIIEVGGNTDVTNIVPPTFDGFRLQNANPAQSTQFSMVNGTTSYTKSFTYYLYATREGTLTIGSASVTAGGKTYKTDPVKVTVSKSANAASGKPDATVSPKDIFITVTADKKKLYFGEPAIVTYKLYFKADLTRYQVTQDAKSEGFWIEKFDNDKQQQLQTSREVIKGEVYRVATVNKIEVFPNKTGDLEISPYQANCQVLLSTVSRKRSLDPFAEFDDFFGRLGKTVSVDLTSPAVKLQVEPLPEEGKPVGFSNAVGKYNFSATIDKQKVKAGEAITLRLTVTGNGNVNTIPEPELKLPQSFEKYDPKINKQIDKSTGIVLGKKVSEYVLIPRASGKYEIPPIEFSAFNPQTKKYDETKTPPFEITVDPGDGMIAGMATSSDGLSKREIEKFGEDIRFIKTDGGSLTKSGGRFYKHPLFYAAMILPLLVLGFASYKERQDIRMRGDIVYARQRQASPEAKKRLKLAKQFLKSGKEKEFYTEIEAAIIKFIGNKFNADGQAMTRDEVRAFLESRKLSPESIASCVSVLEKAEFYRFAPKQSAMEQMQPVYDAAEDSISEISKL